MTMTEDLYDDMKSWNNVLRKQHAAWHNLVLWWIHNVQSFFVRKVKMFSKCDDMRKGTYLRIVGNDQPSIAMHFGIYCLWRWPFNPWPWNIVSVMCTW